MKHDETVLSLLLSHVLIMFKSCLSLLLSYVLSHVLSHV